MFPERWLDKASTGEKVAADLRLRIIEGEYKAGDKLSENQLANMYALSRSPIRDAIKILANEQLISLERMGFIIIGLNSRDIEEIYDIRLLIERFVFERLQSIETGLLERELQKIVEMMKVAVKFGDAEEFSYQDIMFHQTIIYSIHHKQLMKQWINIRPIMETLVLISMRNRMKNNPEDFKRVIDNHELYIKAISSKDRELFQEAMHVNFDDVDEKIEDVFHSQNKGG